MPTREEVDQQLKDLHIDDTMRFNIRKEIEVLPTVLEQDEKIRLLKQT